MKHALQSMKYLCLLGLGSFNSAQFSFSVMSDSLRPHKLRRQWQPTLVLLAGKSHGQRILVGESEWSHNELEMT